MLVAEMPEAEAEANVSQIVLAGPSRIRTVSTAMKDQSGRETSSGSRALFPLVLGYVYRNLSSGMKHVIEEVVLRQHVSRL